MSTDSRVAVPSAPFTPSARELYEHGLRFLRDRVARRDLDPMTARNYRSALRPFAAVVGGLPYTSEDIEQWKASRAHLRPSSRRREFSMVRCFTTWLVRQGLLPFDPTLDVQAPRLSRTVPRALESKAVGKLLAVAPDRRARAVILMMVGLGLRCVEVERLELGDWDRRAQTMLIHGKFDHERLLPLPEMVVHGIEDYLVEYPASSGPIIRSYRRPGHALRSDTLSGMVSEWMNAAGVKRMPRDGVSAHALRHTAASDVLDRCEDLRVVQEMLGHQNLSTTSVYLRRAGMGKLREAMEGRCYTLDIVDTS